MVAICCFNDEMNSSAKSPKLIAFADQRLATFRNQASLHLLRRELTPRMLEDLGVSVVQGGQYQG